MNIKCFLGMHDLEHVGTSEYHTRYISGVEAKHYLRYYMCKRCGDRTTSIASGSPLHAERHATLINDSRDWVESGVIDGKAV